MSRLLTLALVVTLLAGCTTLVPVDPRDPQALAQRVNKGDTVQIVSRGGERSGFVVTGRDESSISGDDKRVALADIERLDVRAYDARKTALVIVGVLLAAWFLEAWNTAWPRPGP